MAYIVMAVCLVVWGVGVTYSYGLYSYGRLLRRRRAVRAADLPVRILCIGCDCIDP